jgi:Rrf2 family protein
MAPGPGRPAGSGIVWPSAKAVYTLRACAALAAAYPDGRLLKASEIATAGRAPTRFLSKILGELRDASLVSARRGHHGGYALARDPSDIRIAELMVAVGAPELLVPLPPQLEQPRSEFVDDLRRRLTEIATDAFGSATVADIARESISSSEGA